MSFLLSSILESDFVRHCLLFAWEGAGKQPAGDEPFVSDQIAWLPDGFNHPWVLWFLLIPVLLIAWRWTHRTGGVAIPVDHSSHGSGKFLRILINLALTLPLLMMGVVIWILAGPVQLGKPTTKRSVTNIEFCVDISGSMTAPFGEGTRYDASMKAINQFLDFREGDAFGLTFFGNSVLHWCPLTTDSSAIRCSPPFMRPEVVPYWFGGTEIGKALLACRRILMERKEGDRMILLVSDGQSFDIEGENGTTIARQLSDEGIVVYAIYIGSGEPPDGMVTVTTLTGGEVFNPADEDSLAHVFQKIDSMEKARIEQTVAEQLDHFRPYAVVGLILLVASLLGAYGLRYTPW